MKLSIILTAALAAGFLALSGSARANDLIMVQNPHGPSPYLLFTADRTPKMTVALFAGERGVGTVRTTDSRNEEAWDTRLKYGPHGMQPVVFVRE